MNPIIDSSFALNNIIDYNTPTTPKSPQHLQIIELIPYALERGQSVSGILDKSKKIIPIKQLEANLDQTIIEWEKNIEEEINQKRLELGMSPHVKHKDFSKKQSAIEFLERVLPRSILQNPDLAILPKAYVRLEWSTALMQSLESGLTVLTLIYKSVILQAARKMITDIKIIYKKDPHKKGRHEILKAIKEWEINLKEQEKNIQDDFWKYGMLISSYLSTATEKVVRILPLGFSGSTHLLSLLGSFGSIFAIIFSGLSYAQRKSAAKIYQSWIDNYTKLENQYTKIFHPDKIERDLTHVRAPSALESIDTYKRKYVYTAELEKIFTANKNINEIRKYLRQFNISLPTSIHNQDQLMENWKTNRKFKKGLITQFANYNNTIWTLRNIAEKSENLLQKREAKAALKVAQLRLNFEKEIEKPVFLEYANKHLLSKYTEPFDQILQMAPTSDFSDIVEKTKDLQIPIPKTIKTKNDLVKFLTYIRNDKEQLSKLFKEWLLTNPDENFLKQYVDHQETIGQVVKQSLKTIISEKLKLEKKFFDFSLKFSKSYFYSVLISLSIAIALGFLITYGAPLLVGLGLMAAAQIALYLFSFSGIVLTTGFVIRGYQMWCKYKPLAPTMLETIKLSIKSIQANMLEADHLYKQRKFLKTSKILNSLHHAHKNYARAHRAYKEAKLEFEESEKKFNDWLKMVHQLEENLTDRAWQDFIQFSKLPPDKTFDILNALKNALKSCDLNLLDEETKMLLTQQLGIDFEDLEEQLKIAPENIIRTIRNFIGFDEERMKTFIKHQLRQQ